MSNFLSAPHTFPFSAEKKGAYLISIFKKTDPRIPFASFIDPIALEMQSAAEDSDLTGRMPGEGICFGIVRTKIESAITGEPVPESKARFPEASQLVHKHAGVPIEQMLPKRVEETLQTHLAASSEEGAIYSLPRILISMYRKSPGKPQHYMILLGIQLPGKK